jgi:hypothetical protein
MRDSRTAERIQKDIHPGPRRADHLAQHCFTGSPPDKAIWMLIGGVLLSIVGVLGLFRG